MKSAVNSVSPNVRWVIASSKQLAFLFLLMLCFGRIDAQGSPGSGVQRATRDELAKLAAQIEAEVSLGKLKGEKLVAKRSELAGIRQRLERGDFQVGDRFLLAFRLDSVRVDTASVRDSLKVSILALPDFSVAGVLRSELNDKLSAHVSRYVRNADVRANVLTRISVMGAVRSPGFYYASPDRPLSDLLMLAGGPAEDAKLNEIEIFRGTTRLLRAKDSKRVLEQGFTLEQMDVQSGDEVRVARKKQRIRAQTVFQLLFVLSGLFLGLVNFLTWYYGREEG